MICFTPIVTIGYEFEALPAAICACRRATQFIPDGHDGSKTFNCLLLEILYLFVIVTYFIFMMKVALSGCFDAVRRRVRY